MDILSSSLVGRKRFILLLDFNCLRETFNSYCASSLDNVDATLEPTLANFIMFWCFDGGGSPAQLPDEFGACSL